MRLLDLFCGAGGAAMGYHQAGFEDIVGIDNQPQPNYPFTFIQADALKPPVRLNDFDLIHASPPCQRWAEAGTDRKRGQDHPDYLTPIRETLQGQSSQWVIENIPTAPIAGCFLVMRSDVRVAHCETSTIRDVRVHGASAVALSSATVCQVSRSWAGCLPLCSRLLGRGMAGTCASNGMALDDVTRSG